MDGRRLHYERGQESALRARTIVPHRPSATRAASMDSPSSPGKRPMRSPSPGSALRSLLPPKKLSLLLEQDAYVVFLDVDGVLHPHAVTSEDQFFNPSCVDALEHLLKQTGAHVVLSSFWRESPANVARINSVLDSRGLPHILGSTPSMLLGSRTEEIRRWLTLYATEGKYPQVVHWARPPWKAALAHAPSIGPHAILHSQHQCGHAQAPTPRRSGLRSMTCYCTGCARTWCTRTRGWA